MIRICFWVTLFAYFFCFDCNAQIAEGKITYLLKYPELDLPAEQMAFLPSEAVTYFKDGKSRTEINAALAVKSITISTKSEVLFLIDMMGDKKVYRKKNEALAKSNAVKIENESKKIAGHECKKAIVIAGGDSMEVWFASDIIGGGSWGGSFGEISGAPMEFVVNKPGVKLLMSAISVNEEIVNFDMFNVPSDYIEVSGSEMENGFSR